MHSNAIKFAIPVVVSGLLGVLVSACGCKVATPTCSYSYEVHYESIERDRLDIPIILERPVKPKKVFWSAFYGVNVDSVIADGQTIRPEPYSLPLAEYSWRSRGATSGVLYVITTWTPRPRDENQDVWGLVSIRDYDPKAGGFSASIIHRITNSATRIEINYRIRFADGQLGQPCVAVLLMEPPPIEDSAVPSEAEAD